jgi:hypothetical protein
MTTEQAQAASRNQERNPQLAGLEACKDLVETANRQQHAFPEVAMPLAIQQDSGHRQTVCQHHAAHNKNAHMQAMTQVWQRSPGVLEKEDRDEMWLHHLAGTYGKWKEQPNAGAGGMRGKRLRLHSAQQADNGPRYLTARSQGVH